MTLEKIDNILI